MKILVIDNYDSFVYNLVHYLEDLDCEVTTVPDGSVVLSNYSGREFDLVITDIIMPGVEGLEVLKHLRRHSPNFKAIAISGGGRLEPSFHLRLARRLGASVTLRKPFRLKALLEAVAHVLEQDSEIKGQSEMLGASRQQTETKKMEEKSIASAKLTPSSL